jgi:hypothetical protein
MESQSPMNTSVTEPTQFNITHPGAVLVRSSWRANSYEAL